MSLAPLDVPRRRFTAADVTRMVAAGILGEDDPLELIDGELIIVSPQGTVHRGLTVRIRRLLEAAFGPSFHVQDHSPIDAGPDSLPEPDVAVVRGDVDTFLDHHPTGADLALVVEISVTTQAMDRAKAAVYARAGVAEYWNLDVEARRLTVYRHPHPDRAEYALAEFLHAEDHVAAASVTLPVSRLLP
ncbi:MAG: Uma2 family endonuclease [Myxococcota bacterium]